MSFIKVSFAFVCLLLVGDGAVAQSTLRCEGIDRVEPPAGVTPITVDRVQGQAVFAPVGDEQETFRANGVCVLLFSQGDATPLLTGTTDDEGGFVLSPPAPGSYVLVAAFEPIDDFAVRLQLSDTPPDAAAERGVLLHLRGKEDDRRSFASVIASLTLRRELVEMERLDQAVRMEMIRDGVGTPSAELLARMAAIDGRNTRRLQEIVAGHGWPSPDLVGQDGAGAAFILLQHASYDAQKALFPLVEAGHRDGTVPGQSYALLLDSILVWEGKPQVYGSAARPVDEWVDGEPTFWPIDDEADVDRRRAEMGLSPLAEYRELLKRLNFPDE